MTKCFFGSLFPPVDEVIENAFERDLGDIIQRYTGYRRGYDRPRPCKYALATLIQHTAGTQHPCID